jgi:hypothetical protein
MKECRVSLVSIRHSTLVPIFGHVLPESQRLKLVSLSREDELPLCLRS